MQKDPVILRIQNGLRNKWNDLTWEEISEEIQLENGGDPAAAIDRRVLARLCKDESVLKVKLSMAQMIALDKYFKAQCGGPLFQHSRTLLDSIADSNDVNFLVATKFHQGMHTDVVSRRDLDAIARLLSTELGRRHVGLAGVSDSFPWTGEDDASLRHSALLSIGSPIANIASHRLLANMLGLKEVTKQTPDQDLPFFIVRRETTDRSVKSGFVRRRASAISKRAERAQLISTEHRAIVVGDKSYVCDAKTDYAMLVAQRDPDSGHVRAVLAGLSGLGTYQLAKILANDELIRDVPPLLDGMRHPPILVAVFRLVLEGSARPTRAAAGRSRGRLALVTLNDPVVHSVTPADPAVFFRYEDDTWRPEYGTG